MKCEDCNDDRNCDIQKRNKENEDNGVGAVYIGDTLEGCNKHDDDGRDYTILHMRTEG
tara:strand:- start:634 stop:807 length:174 start_codon:yes stop_codon:yes gene_type:complete